MSQDPNYSQTVSLKLSEVLSDIGVNDRLVLKRRRTTLLQETALNTPDWLVGKPYQIYYFGSQSEGSTTPGLMSDWDALRVTLFVNVIQDWSEWQLDMINYMMIQDETTSPGYCLLQCLRADEPLPLGFHLSNFYTYTGGRLLANNTIYKDIIEEQLQINGPALTIQELPGVAGIDFVEAFHCKSWPIEAQPWLVRQGIGGWPTEEMKRYCGTTGCFVVPVSSKSGQYETLEWRISTSQAERCLMFCLNITQMRCYILMKMILKTIINPQCDGVLSSFMCKNVVFLCIQNTSSNKWQGHNLLACLNCCLSALQNCIRQENCPHFIIQRNNLMAGKISSSNKHRLLEILQVIIQSEGRALLEIPIDQLGLRLMVKMNMLPAVIDEADPNYIIPSHLLVMCATAVYHNHNTLVKSIMPGENEVVQQKLSDFICTLAGTCREADLNTLEKSVFRLLTYPLCSSLASVTASNDIYTNNTLSPLALAWFSAGLNSDVSSGRLKLASALYCVGDINTTEFVLRHTEDVYDLNIVEPVCCCYTYLSSCPRPGFCYKSNTGNEELIKHVTAFCVKFLRCEINCVPHELQYEMFRSTHEEMLYRHEHTDNWMDSAAVDSLPYLYFLQYKTYGHLHKAAEQHQALTNLVATIGTEPNFRHTETALNLLGQCMELENRHMDALHCYMLSLNVLASNNAAKIHICRLLNVLVKRQAQSNLC